MEQILQKLSEIEITAQRIMQDADRTKAALSAEMEQQSNRKIQALRDSLESRKDQELTALRQQTEQHLADLDVYYKKNHQQLSEDLFQQLLKR